MPRKPGLESTATLLARVRKGDNAARERLAGRYLPILRAWAAGRLPRWARDLTETDDLVQIALTRALDRVREFEPRREGAFLAYLRSIILNEIRDQIRRAKRKPVVEEMRADPSDPHPSPLEEAIGRQTLDAYDEALARLPDRQREAIVLRIEMGFTYEQIADAVECPTANAARMLVARGLARLAEGFDGR